MSRDPVIKKLYGTLRCRAPSAYSCSDVPVSAHERLAHFGPFVVYIVYVSF